MVDLLGTADSPLHFPHGIYWCVRGNEVPHPLVQDSLAEYAGRLDWPVPENPGRPWYLARLTELGMVTTAPPHTPTRAGLLLFGRDPQVTVQIEHTGGRETFAGNLLHVLDRTLTVLAELNAPFRLKGPTSLTVRPFPPAALKEIVANALVHRSYDTPAPVRITVGDQSLQVVSPGGLVGDLAADRLGEPGVRGYRNPVIADFWCAQQDGR